MLSEKALKAINFFYFKNRHIFLYAIFGFTSILFELFTRYLLLTFLSISFFSTIVPLIAGIFLAFFLNIKFNFYLKKNAVKKALIFFSSISLFSFSIQKVIANLKILEFSYEINRVIISGSFFIFAYILHKKYSFKDNKKIGVAVYINGDEKVQKIYEKVGQYPDIIHADLVDSSFNMESSEINFYKFEIIKSYWPDLIVHTHLMSKYPSKYVKRIAEYSDVIFFHQEIDEDIQKVKDLILSKGSIPGLALQSKTVLNGIPSIIKDFENILLLTIEKPGFSGQKFMLGGFDLIKNFNEFKNKHKFNFCVDGGINQTNFKDIDADILISGSNILDNKSPKKQIMLLHSL